MTAKKKPQDKEPTQINISYLLGHLHHPTQHDTGKFLQYYDPRYGHHFPYFNFSTIQHMLLDPRIKYGLNLIKGPIATYTRFFTQEESESPSIHQAIVELDIHFPYMVRCDNKKQEEYILRQANRFWNVGIFKAMRAIEWGFSGSQVLYKQTQKHKLEFDNLHSYHPVDLRAISNKGGIVGFIKGNNSNKYVPIGKAFWHVHERQEDMFYGNSRLRGAHIPWHETWMIGGARDIRRTWYFKNAYDGGQLYYPEGFYQDENGQKVPNEHLAVTMMENKRTGSTAIFPAQKGLDGKRDWEYEPPKANVTPSGMEQYIQLLRDEELEGMGIPPEVVQSSSGNGLGSATGRMVPLMAFIASLTPLVTDLLGDFRSQILDNVLLPINGFQDDYEFVRIVPKSVEGYQAENPTSKIQQTESNVGLS